MEKNKLNLAEIQAKIHAPKNQRNNFGKYNYRSCEDILEAAKKVLADYDAYVIINDEVVQVGDRIYIKATATLSNANDSVSTTAYAREEETKKGMDVSQITGSASSYARKYALNGLFAIDDTKDSDATNEHGKQVDKKTAAKPVQKEEAKTPAAKANIEEMKKSLHDSVFEARKYRAITEAQYNKITGSIDTLSEAELADTIAWIEKKLYTPKAKV